MAPQGRGLMEDKAEVQGPQSEGVEGGPSLPERGQCFQEALPRPVGVRCGLLQAAASGTSRARSNQVDKGTEEAEGPRLRPQDPDLPAVTKTRHTDPLLHTPVRKGSKETGRSSESYSVFI